VLNITRWITAVAVKVADGRPADADADAMNE
jgi:hypothetical protein